MKLTEPRFIRITGFSGIPNAEKEENRELRRNLFITSLNLCVYLLISCSLR